MNQLIYGVIFVVLIAVHGSKVQVTKDDLMKDTTAIFQEALQAAAEEEHFKGTERGQGVLKICRQMLAALTTSITFLTMVNIIVAKIYDAASAGDNSHIGPVANSRMCSTFHGARIDPQLNKLWEDMISEIGLSLPVYVVRLTQQFLMRKILLIITTRRLKHESAKGVREVNLTDHDQNVIRYVAGYIPHALLKRYRKKISGKAKQFCDILQSWKSGQEDIEADSFLEYTCTWTNLINRGCLFLVNDNVFKLFIAMEVQTQKLLDMDMAQSKNLGEFLCQNISSNVSVVRCWQVTCEDLSEEDSEILFSSVLNYWVKIRVKAFVKVYLNTLRKEEILQKKQKKLSKKGDKSLRKSLSKNE